MNGTYIVSGSTDDANHLAQRARAPFSRVTTHVAVVWRTGLTSSSCSEC
jgi:hypothetical protein